MGKEKKYIDINDNIYTVKRYNENELEEGFAYIYKDKYVLPYYGYVDSVKQMNKPGIYLDIEDKIIIKRPIKKKGKYSINKIYDNVRKEKKYVDIDNIIYIVKKFDNDSELEEGFAYVYKDNMVLPYYGRVYSKKEMNKPGIYINNKGQVVIKRSLRKNSKYAINKIYGLDVDHILSIIEGEGITGVEDTILGDNDEIFAPPILDDDNALQKLIKMILQEMQIDLRTRQHLFNSPTDLNNTRRSLLHHGKMSFEKFLKWIDILGKNFEILVYDLDEHDKDKPIKYKYK